MSKNGKKEAYKKNLTELLNFYLNELDNDKKTNHELSAKAQLLLLDFAERHEKFSPFVSVFSENRYVEQLKEIIRRTDRKDVFHSFFADILPLFEKLFINEQDFGEKEFKYFLDLLIFEKPENEELEFYFKSYISDLYKLLTFNIYKEVKTRLPKIKKDENIKYFWSNFYLLKNEHELKTFHDQLETFRKKWKLYFTSVRTADKIFSYFPQDSFIRKFKIFLKEMLLYADEYELRKFFSCENPDKTAWIKRVSKNTESFIYTQHFLTDLLKGFVFPYSDWIIKEPEFKKHITEEFWKKESGFIRFLNKLGFIEKDILKQPDVSDFICERTNKYFDSLSNLEKIILIGIMIGDKFLDTVEEISANIKFVFETNIILEFYHTVNLFKSGISDMLSFYKGIIINPVSREGQIYQFDSKNIMKNIFKDLLFAYPIKLQKTLINEVKKHFNSEDSILFLQEEGHLYLLMFMLMNIDSVDIDEKKLLKKIIDTHIYWKDQSEKKELYIIIDDILHDLERLQKDEEIKILEKQEKKKKEPLSSIEKHAKSKTDIESEKELSVKEHGAGEISGEEVSDTVFPDKEADVSEVSEKESDEMKEDGLQKGMESEYGSQIEEDVRYDFNNENAVEVFSSDEKQIKDSSQKETEDDSQIEEDIRNGYDIEKYPGRVSHKEKEIEDSSLKGTETKAVSQKEKEIEDNIGDVFDIGSRPEDAFDLTAAEDISFDENPEEKSSSKLAQGELTHEMVEEIETTMPQEHPERVDVMEILIEWTMDPDKLELLDIVNSNQKLVHALIHDRELISLIESKAGHDGIKKILNTFNEKTDVSEFKVVISNLK